jgi:hypothetical protein
MPADCPTVYPEVLDHEVDPDESVKSAEYEYEPEVERT